ncbi:protein crumbs [Schistocerca nitens]|uniref:protein crumbs n=1 Tax=Schistocerca nitens TaxID=7011 RepID=UPI0021191FA9|nr:protein crumbs [Schistocerca nitens]
MELKVQHNWCLLFILFFAESVSAVYREGYFNGSSFVSLSTPVNLKNHTGLSFRTCVGGELFFQQGKPGYSLLLSVRSEGLLFVAVVNGRAIKTLLNARFLDNEWHNINLMYRLGNLTLSAGSHQKTVANSTFNPEIIQYSEMFRNNVVLLGREFVGCILEGPGLVLTTSVDSQQNVRWEPCPLPTKSCYKPDPCAGDPCRMRGECIPLDDSYECRCNARYSGNNCELDLGHPCDRNPCQYGGRCQIDDFGNYSCICDPMRTGQHCESDMSTHPCNANPCENNGTCHVQDKTYKCSCLPGFEGHRCEIDIDDCVSSPCRNGATCVDQVNSYYCNCSHGFTGLHCEENINECEDKPCLNSLGCFDNYGSYTCQCSPGFEGQNCELIINECLSSPCLNGATCVNKVGSYTCQCLPGYTGDHCENFTLDCDRISCPPSTHCLEMAGVYHCVCKPGYRAISGTSCTELDLCDSSQFCKNGGTCFISDKRVCVCPPGFTGQSCQTVIDTCWPGTCQNGGTCIEQPNGYTCRCPEGYSGYNCEDYDICKLTVCYNGGTCYARNKREYHCACTPGFEGRQCEISIGGCTPMSCPEGKICKEKTNGIECQCPGNYRGENCSEHGFCIGQPCENGGTCVELEYNYTCNCPPGFTGPKCADDIDECVGPIKPCKNGICINNNGSYDCFCTPGYAGAFCELDIDECLSKPCYNNATCINQINSYRCTCTEGYTGHDCETDINECESQPCENDGICIDEIGSFSCQCMPGFTGVTCTANINECMSSPCSNGGICIDGINSYMCNCTNTGYEGPHCELNIDDCQQNPCQNGGECIDGFKDYECRCHPGYRGKNCEIDINECEVNPCEYGGTCLQRSNETLYGNISDLPDVFHQDFSYSAAEGYECLCIRGTSGINCQVNNNECEKHSCINGACIDGIDSYTCDCEPGYEGEFCDTQINECERYKPCGSHGNCTDLLADYTCACEANYGGKNCSVRLTGCTENACQNNGTCRPYLENEIDHKFNCTCLSGFHGELCEKITTMSMNGTAYMMLNTSRDEGYDIQFRFKTTLPNGLLAFGMGLTFYVLELTEGRLNLHSSLLNKWEGVFIGSDLNDSKWQKVFVAINTTHLVLAANEEQTIYPITLNENSNSSHTSFSATYLGGTVVPIKLLTHTPSFFIGCMEDVMINEVWVDPQHELPSQMLQHVQVGCPREPQCNPNRCHNEGQCTDLWQDFKCICKRPYLGNTCQFNLTAATFGHENITTSLVTVDVNEASRRAIRSIIDISMFIRTKQDKGAIFYMTSVGSPNQTVIAAHLSDGALNVCILLNGTPESNPESWNVNSLKLADGNYHLIQVVRNVTLVQVKINGTEHFRKTISATGFLDVQRLYLGGYPSVSQTVGLTNSTTNRGCNSNSCDVNFKGVIQDVQISNGSHTMVVEFFPLDVEDLVIPSPLGTVSFNKSVVLEGSVSDNTCLVNPCEHNGKCVVTWNDFQCECMRGYKGKTCQEMEFCQLQDCPPGSTCRNLDDGFECIANTTFNGLNASFVYALNITTDEERIMQQMTSLKINYRSRTGGNILYISTEDESYFSVYVYKDVITVSWKLGANIPPQRNTLWKSAPDGNWTTISIRMSDEGIYGNTDSSQEESRLSTNFSLSLWHNLLLKAKFVVGGGVDSGNLRNSWFYKMDDITVEPITVNPLDTNAIDSLHTPSVDHPENHGSFFKGCLGEIRIGNLLVPYLEETFPENFTEKDRFYLTRENSMVPILGCVLCFQIDCRNNGTCTDENESYDCTCQRGFEGSDCSENTDDCKNNSCQNNSTCVDEIAAYSCKCQPGWEGEWCEQNIDECLSFPCLNGGTCIDGIATVECRCADGYIGPFCKEIKLVTCADMPCRNSSTCLEVTDPEADRLFKCVCAEGFVGDYCDTPYCVVKKCDNGICDYNNKSPECKCYSGYKGRYCEEDIDDCAAVRNPCNTGKCIDGNGTFLCDCSDTGFEGDYCEIDIDECALRTALCAIGRFHSCENVPGSYRCNCKHDFCGQRCHISNPCTESPENLCQNGGTCNPECNAPPPYYTCNCTGEYTGINCTELPLAEASDATDIAIIVTPIVGAVILVIVISLTVLISMAKKKRATRGTYSPSQQEYCNPRVEMDNVMKPPPEERLI